jgi:hypothetical protein
MREHVLTVLELARLQAEGVLTTFGGILIGPVCQLLGTGRFYMEFFGTSGQLLGSVDGDQSLLIKVDLPA